MVAGMYELYEQLLPTKLYTSKRIKTCLPDDVMCQLCGKCPESGPHIFAGCSALAHCKYLERHNSALKGQMSGCKDSSSSRKDRNDSGNELPLDPELREERQGEGGEVWVPMLGA
ncbi:unnamed protein product [Porites lobata]|uniref:Reverse transcriptase zinc-binding domain-containing protein n=1 Tax=Porites lobata TaxID=104759 RepID=A0ABN8NEG7_9CNID|nr:unnamed protein product [Porites lobata]